MSGLREQGSRDHEEAAAAQQRQRDREDQRATKRAELEGCARFDASLVMIITRFERADSFLTHPRRSASSPAGS